MRKKEWKQLGMVLCVAALFIIVIVTVMNFTKTKEIIDLTPDHPTEKEEFQNTSTMSEQRIRELVEEKRMALKDFFHDAQYYNIGDVSKNHTSSDNEHYVVVDTNFLNQLRNLLTLSAYNFYFDEMSEIEISSDVSIAGPLYMVSRDLFDSIYVASAIPSYDVTEELLILESATDDKIEAKENIKLCDENDYCPRNDFYQLLLEKEDNVWKIADFTTPIM